MPVPYPKGATKKQPYVTLALKPEHMPSVILPDRRQFDFFEARIFGGDLYDLNENSIRWRVQIEAHERMACETYFFSVWIYWSVVEKDELPMFDKERYPALLKMSAARIAEYLRFHPFPSYGCYNHQTIVLEIT